MMVQDLAYSQTHGDEVEDLFNLLHFVKKRLDGVEAVASGAIASSYQRTRVENVRLQHHNIQKALKNDDLYLQTSHLAHGQAYY